jgi:hypothetical protein
MLLYDAKKGVLSCIRILAVFLDLASDLCMVGVARSSWTVVATVQCMEEGWKGGRESDAL